MYTDRGCSQTRLCALDVGSSFFAARCLGHAFPSRWCPGVFSPSLLSPSLPVVRTARVVLLVGISFFLPCLRSVRGSLIFNLPRPFRCVGDALILFRREKTTTHGWGVVLSVHSFHTSNPGNDACAVLMPFVRLVRGERQRYSTPCLLYSGRPLLSSTISKRHVPYFLPWLYRIALR